MKINDKILRLVKHGLKATNLTKLNESQINGLYTRLVEQVTKKTETTYNVKGGGKVVPSGNYTATLDPKDPNSVNLTPVTGSVTEKTEIDEKAVSKKQQGLMGAAYSVEKGDKELKDIPKSYRGKVKKVVDSMTKKQVKDFAKTKHKRLPNKVETNEDNPYNLGKALENAYAKGAMGAAQKMVPNVSFGESELEREITKLVERHLSPKMTKKDFMNIIENNVIVSRDINEEIGEEMELPSWLRWENITKK